MNWLKNLISPKQTPIASPKIETRPASTRHDMTLERWQKDDHLVTWARTSEEFAYLLAVVINAQPTGFPVRGQQVTDTQCNIELGRKEGYADCENVLFALRQFPAKAVPEIEADYDNTDYSPEQAEA